MSDEVRGIVDALNKAPFNKSLTLIAFVWCLLLGLMARFDSLEPLSLLQTLNDVFSQISPEVCDSFLSVLMSVAQGESPRRRPRANNHAHALLASRAQVSTAVWRSVCISSFSQA